MTTDNVHVQAIVARMKQLTQPPVTKTCTMNALPDGSVPRLLCHDTQSARFYTFSFSPSLVTEFILFQIFYWRFLLTLMRLHCVMSAALVNVGSRCVLVMKCGGIN